MDTFVRTAIQDIILKHKNDVIKIAIKQRAKFEGWLKFELACFLMKNGAQDVEVESLFDSRSYKRSDISFTYNSIRYQLELKTSNTSYSINGVRSCVNPFRKNIDSIISDTKKLNSEQGIIAFVLFPVPPEDNKWQKYLHQISIETDIDIDTEENCSVININYNSENSFTNDGIDCDIIICTYMSKQFI